MQLLDIGEVVRRSGVAASALRHYEAIGLIEAVGRRGLRRQFEPNVLAQLSVIALGRAAGFSLDEIKELFAKTARFELPRDKLLEKAAALEVQIRKLKSLQSMIRHVAECSAPSHFECSKFQKLMRLALSPKSPKPKPTRDEGVGADRADAAVSEGDRPSRRS